MFLTAKDATEDKVPASVGADDYVTKPFSLEEMVARRADGAPADPRDAKGRCASPT